MVWRKTTRAILTLDIFYSTEYSSSVEVMYGRYTVTLSLLSLQSNELPVAGTNNDAPKKSA
jgi:hypothetical protein